MEIQYIYHSSFCIKLNKTVLLFDYFQGEMPVFSEDSSLYIFVSHKHHDHYDPCIFQLSEKYKDVTYVLSKDIRMNSGYMDRLKIPESARSNIIYVNKKDSVFLKDKYGQDIHIETLASTDAGVAFLIACYGKIIYHAGDHNWWAWKEDTREEARQMENAFKAEIKKLEGRKIDVAFLPLDPRLEENYYYGFDYFMRHINPKKAVPMHFSYDPSVIARFMECEQSMDYRDQIIDDIFGGTQ